MKIFVTGASGYIGAAVVKELVDAGHLVWGLTRSKSGPVSRLGATAVIGDLRKPDGWKQAAEAADALIHLGFEFGPEAQEVDHAGLKALIEASQKGAAKTLVYTSGVWVLGPRPDAPTDETAEPAPLPIVAWRPAHEALALEKASEKLRVIVARPGCVFGGRGGLYGMMLDSLLKDRTIKVVGGGENAWANVHLDDLSLFYRFIVEQRPESGILHATNGSVETVRAIAEAFIEAHGGGSLTEWPLAAAKEALGPFADALVLDQQVSSAKARKVLGWKPAWTSLIDDAEDLLAEFRAVEAPVNP